jgi:hypothetical protein
MPYSRQIADIEQEIAGVCAAIETMRARKRQAADLDRFLVQLARLKAERQRLMMRQSIVPAGK